MWLVTYIVCWAKWQGWLDQRSDEVESQVAIDFRMTDICNERCLFLLAWHVCDAAIVFWQGIREAEHSGHHHWHVGLDHYKPTNWLAWDAHYKFKWKWNPKLHFKFDHINFLSFLCILLKLLESSVDNGLNADLTALDGVGALALPAVEIGEHADPFHVVGHSVTLLSFDSFATLSSNLLGCSVEQGTRGGAWRSWQWRCQGKQWHPQCLRSGWQGEWRSQCWQSGCGGCQVWWRLWQMQ